MNKNLIKKLLLVSISALMAVTSTGIIASAHHITHIRNHQQIKRAQVAYRYHHLNHHHLLLILKTKSKAKNNHHNQQVKAQKVFTPIATAKNSTYHKHQYKHMLKIAKSKLGDKYEYGASGLHRFDCAGYTQYIYKHGLHKQIPRTAQAQYDNYPHVKHAKAGDLVFFGASNRAITHVGMYIGRGNMIDAQLRGVVIEKIHAPWWHLVGVSRPVNLH